MARRVTPRRRVNCSFYSLGISLVILFTIHQYLPISTATSDRVTSSNIVEDDGSKEINIRVDKICKALWDADYKLMSLILEKQLPHLLPCRNSTQGFTIFVPHDHFLFSLTTKLMVDFPITLEKQIVLSRLEGPKDFESLAKGYSLATCDSSFNLTVTMSPFTDIGYFALNNRKVRHSNIYKDEHVVVHGVFNYFEHGRWSTIPHRLFERKKSWLPDDDDVEFCGCSH